MKIHMKISPEERWRAHALERFAAMKVSGELDRLRKKGLKIVGRKNKYTAKAWWGSFDDRLSCPGYKEWQQECKAAGKRFGLAHWTIECSCLISKYDPAKASFPIESPWPQICIVTENTNPRFLRHLSYEAQKLGLRVIQRQGSVETTIINITPPPGELSPMDKPPRENAFTLRKETPLPYPPEAAVELHKEGDKKCRELLKQLGYSIPQRLRSSPLISRADKLRLSKDRLDNREAYDIMDETHPNGDWRKEKRRRKEIASSRYKLKKRLKKPYEPGC